MAYAVNRTRWLGPTRRGASHGFQVVGGWVSPAVVGDVVQERGITAGMSAERKGAGRSALGCDWSGLRAEVMDGASRLSPITAQRASVDRFLPSAHPRSVVVPRPGEGLA